MTDISARLAQNRARADSLYDLAARADRDQRAMMVRAEASLIRVALFMAGWITGCAMCASLASWGW